MPSHCTKQRMMFSPLLHPATNPKECAAQKQMMIAPLLRPATNPRNPRCAISHQWVLAAQHPFGVNSNPQKQKV